MGSNRIISEQLVEETVSKATVIDLFVPLSHHLPERTKEDHRKMSEASQSWI